MHIEVNDNRLWFDVEGAALVPDGSRMRERPTVLLLHGGSGSGGLDPITPVAAAREIVAFMPEGTARLEVLEGAGHFPWRDVPDRYWPLMMEFVAAADRQP